MTYKHETRGLKKKTKTIFKHNNLLLQVATD